MQYDQHRIQQIHLPRPLWAAIKEHCLRKMAGEFHTGEQPEKKAFGLIGGELRGTTLSVTMVIPLKKNARSSNDHRRRMDGTMRKHAVPSETPLDKRGWVADQEELDAAISAFHANHCRLIGTYHMHRVAWPHDPIRDTPTELDTQLGRRSRMFMFIVSTVQPARPVIRAYFEGEADREVPIEITSGEPLEAR